MAWAEQAAQLQQLPGIDQVASSMLPHLIVAQLAQQLVGFTSVVFNQALAQAQVDDLFVEPAYWHQGIGTRLVAAAEQRAHTLGANTVQLVSNPKAQQFYAKQGYLLRTTIDTDLGRAPVLYKHLNG